jgi:hypothetical protein
MPERLSILAQALRKIGTGEDANLVLGVKARRGERRTKASALKAEKLRFVMGWIASAIAPTNEDGLGLSLNDAFDKAAKGFQCLLALHIFVVGFQSFIGRTGGSAIDPPFAVPQTSRTSYHLESYPMAAVGEDPAMVNTVASTIRVTSAQNPMLTLSMVSLAV